MIRLLPALLKSEDGATLVEYALVIALIAVVCILAVGKLGGSTSGLLNKAATSI